MMNGVQERQLGIQGAGESGYTLALRGAGLRLAGCKPVYIWSLNTMKALKVLILVVLVLALIIGGVGMMLPGTYKAEESIVIKAKPETIFPLIGNLKQGEKWTPWSVAKDPTLKRAYINGEQGVGASMAWEGKTFGKGSMTITASDPLKGIEYDLVFNEGQFKSKGTLKMEVVTDGTKVIWTDAGDLGSNPISRWFGLMIPSFLGKDFQAGLASLKDVAEKSGM